MRVVRHSCTCSIASNTSSHLHNWGGGGFYVQGGGRAGHMCRVGDGMCRWGEGVCAGVAGRGVCAG